MVGRFFFNLIVFISVEKMGRLDDKLMHQVDSAIAVSFGLHPEQLV